MKKVSSGGGWPAIKYTFTKAREAGGLLKLWKAMRSRNACKTCALGMGGQKGGMVNESGHFPEVCKKSIQAMVADMQGAITDDFFSTYSIQQLRHFSPKEMEHAGRLTKPMLLVKGEDYYRPLSWEETFDKIVGQLKAVSADETFWYFSGRSSNEAGFLLQMFARLYGTNNVNNCSYYCHQASGVGLNSVLGTGTATIVLEDVEHADLVFVIGGNPASNHPRLMTTLKNVRRKGGEVIVINPVIETGMVNFKVPSDPWSLMFGTKIATEYIQPHIGGDLALITGIAKRVVELGTHDEEFLNAHTHGWPELKTRLTETEWPEIIEKSGVEKAEIDRIAEKYSAAKNVIFSWTMGITHHHHGVENVEAIANLALLRKMVGRPYAGMMPIRGHSNVQGIGSVGVTPKLKDAVFDRLQSHFGVELPTSEGLDTMGCMEEAHAERLKIGFSLGGNLYGSNPASKYAAEALQKLDLLVYMNTTLNTGHAWGTAKETLILPVLARDEEPQPTTQESMFNYVRVSDGGPARHVGPKSEVEVISHIANRVLPESPVDWSGMEHTSRIREAIAEIIPGFEKIKKIGETKEEFQISGRTFYDPQFATADGKANLQTHELPTPHQRENCVRLMTVRSEGQFNTVVYEEYDLYRGIDARDVVLLHPDDVTSLGLSDRQRVTVHSDEGNLPNIEVRAWEKIRAGNALMYYPEANILVPRSTDPRSKTPCFKSVLIWFEA
ncbi:FdhF/YdeP family oxidoreductase [Planctomycetaceae bacterium]|jgi:molybdopterin-dependent oxidoreductase alpha subunit|nr:FdhF/YdeP family oxidoreductase [Planctomycetaceae bacterium]MDC0262232.1 FdhF/YdeP family oxidoreductase [Planctomycetaceae bacterium]MDC0274471.1 FdhF/YdeP family oxidoreductase [Planctomycetaceae bacterium]MDG2388685.1 FdhF/YdeP family oxidoreductase [Planctomycetaceae bacterium]